MISRVLKKGLPCFDEVSMNGKLLISLSGMVEIPRFQEAKVRHAREGGHPGWYEGMNEAQMDSR